MSHRAGYVNIIGNPNVGKSTLLNALLGEQLSITTPKAQTTRHRIFGMLNGEDYQIVFSDTPGIIKPAYALQESMMDFVLSSFEDADVFLYLVEPGIRSLKDEQIYARLKKVQEPVFATDESVKMFGPGHNSFTQTPDGKDVLVYHCRQYTEIEGDPLWNPDRHTFVKHVKWDDNGMPVFGKPGQP